MVINLKKLPRHPFYFYFIIMALESVVFLFLRHRYLHPSTDVLGLPILKEQFGLSIIMKLFVGFNLLLIPMFFLKTKILSSNNQFRSSIVFHILFSISTALIVFQKNLNHHPAHDLALALITFIILTFYLFTVLKFHNILSSDTKKYYLSSSVLLLIPISIYTYMKSISINTDVAKLLLLLYGILFLSFCILLYLNQNFTKNSHFFNLIIIVPYVSFFINSQISKSLNLDAFESFAYVNSKIANLGFKPWRDYSVEHGIWEDLGRNLVAQWLIGSDFWKQSTVISSLIVPLEILVIAILVYFLRNNVWDALLTLLIVSFINISFFSVNFPRMIPVFICSFLLIKLFTTHLNIYLYGISFGLAIALLWTNESIFFVISSILLIAFWVIKTKSLSKISVIKAIGFFFATLLIPLIISGLLKYWIKSFFRDTSGYVVAWAAPFQWEIGPKYFLLVFSIPIIIFFSFQLVYLDILNIYQNRYPFSYKNLWLFPIAVTSAAYYVKFLGWPDWHLAQASSVIFVMLIFWTYLNLSVNRLPTKKIALVILPIIFSLQVIPSINLQEKQKEFGIPNSYLQRIQEVNSTFKKYLPNKKRIKILDFGNEPVTWFGILNYLPAGNSTNVLNLLTQKNQISFLNSLKNSPPDAVIWGGEYGYFTWPIPGNQMKSYLIAEFIINNYMPVVRDGEYILLIPKISNKDIDLDLKIQMAKHGCEWGIAGTKFLPPESVKVNAGNWKNLNSKSLNEVSDNMYFFFRANKNSSIVLTSRIAQTSITFEAKKGAPNQIIWLGGCALWRYFGRDLWDIQGNEENQIEIYVK